MFDGLAKDLLLGALEGINATVFAYGQTGSGKTFTITGGPERYSDRGLIPRSISFLFQSIAQRPTSLYQVEPLPLLPTFRLSCSECVLTQPHKQCLLD